MNDKTKATKNIKTAEAMYIKARAIRNIETAEAMYDSSYLLTETYKKKLGRKERNKIPGRAGSFLITANVLGAFGIENALKALLRREGKDPRNRHNLQALYKELNPDTKRRIHERGAATGIRVEGVIEEHQETFHEWRYRETKKDRLPSLVGLLPSTLWILLETHGEKYGEAVKREKEQGIGQRPPPRAGWNDKYTQNVLMPKSGWIRASVLTAR